MKTLDLFKLMKAIVVYSKDNCNENNNAIVAQKDYCELKHGKEATQKAIDSAFDFIKDHE